MDINEMEDAVGRVKTEYQSSNKVQMNETAFWSLIFLDLLFS